MLNKYKNLSAPLKASFWFLVCGFIQKGIQLISTPIFTRIMSTSEYGQYSVYTSWFGIISIFATLNLASGVFMQGLVKFEDDKEVFTSALQGLSTLTISICATIYILFHKFWDLIFDLPFILMVAMFIDMLLQIAFNFWSGIQRVDYKYKKLIFITIFNALATPIVGVFAVTNFMQKVEARVISSIFINLIAFTSLYIIQFKNGKKFYEKRYWNYALKFNIPLIPHYLSQVVLNQSDRLMIKYMINFDKAGIYSVACSMAMVMSVLNQAILNTLNPWIYKKIKNKEYNDIGSVSYTILIIIAVANFLLIVLAPELIKIMAPKEYYEAIWIIPPVAASIFFMFMYSLFADFEFYFEKTKFIMIASVIGAIINIVLNYIFIPIFGFIVAGYTTLLCYIFYAMGHYYFMRKINKEFMNGENAYNIKVILAISIIFLGVSALVIVLYNYIIIRYSIIAIFIFILILYKNNIIKLFRVLKIEK